MKKSNFVIALIPHRRHRFTKNSFSFEDFYEIFQLNIDFTSGDYILPPKHLKELLFFQEPITAIKEQFRKSGLYCVMMMPVVTLFAPTKVKTRAINCGEMTQLLLI